MGPQVRPGKQWRRWWRWWYGKKKWSYPCPTPPPRHPGSLLWKAKTMKASTVLYGPLAVLVHLTQTHTHNSDPRAPRAIFSRPFWLVDLESGHSLAGRPTILLFLPSSLLHRPPWSPQRIQTSNAMETLRGKETGGRAPGCLSSYPHLPLILIK